MIRRYRRGDAARVYVQKEQLAEKREAVKFFEEITAYSLLDDRDKVVAVFGFRIVGNGAECFSLLGDSMGEKMIEFMRFVNKKIKTEARKRNVENILITVKDGFYNARRMAEMLGFKEVAKLPLFFGNKDYWLFMRKEF